MKVEIILSKATGHPEIWVEGERIEREFTEHGLRDLEFVLAQRRAMSVRCDETMDEHTCGVSASHRDARVVVHLCRACTRTWGPS